MSHTPLMQQMINLWSNRKGNSPEDQSILVTHLAITVPPIQLKLPHPFICKYPIHFIICPKLFNNPFVQYYTQICLQKIPHPNEQHVSQCWQSLTRLYNHILFQQIPQCLWQKVNVQLVCYSHQLNHSLPCCLMEFFLAPQNIEKIPHTLWLIDA